MAISDLYTSGKHQQEIGHFASIVSMAIVDENLSKGEERLLVSAAKKLHISDSEFQRILKNPKAYPINPPVSYNERIERLYSLSRMIIADQKVTEDEMALLHKIAAALHFPVENIDTICDKAIELVAHNNDLESFIEAIKKVNEF